MVYVTPVTNPSYADNLLESTDADDPLSPVIVIVDAGAIELSTADEIVPSDKSSLSNCH